MAPQAKLVLTLMRLRQVRATNPGEPDKKKTRQTSAQVAADNVAKDTEKQKKEDTCTKAISAVSRKENQMATERMLADQKANNPPTTGRKVLRSFIPLEGRACSGFLKMNTADSIILARVQNPAAMGAAFTEAKKLGYAFDGELSSTSQQRHKTTYHF